MSENLHVKRVLHFHTLLFDNDGGLIPNALPLSDLVGASALQI